MNPYFEVLREVLLAGVIGGRDEVVLATRMRFCLRISWIPFFFFFYNCLL